MIGDNKAIVRRFVEEVQNKGNLAAVDELVAPSYVNHSAPAGIPSNREGIKILTQLFRRAFPDGAMMIEDMLAEGDRVVTRKTFRGTHHGEFMGIPPTGKEVVIDRCPLQSACSVPAVVTIVDTAMVGTGIPTSG